jgi:hypothetical protein
VWAHGTFVVKGGLGPPPKGTWSIQTFDEAGVTVTGTTAHSEPEKTITELCAYIASEEVRLSSIERILAAGGNVIPTQRNAMQPYHVTITGLPPEQLDAVFDLPITNPT